MLGLSRNDLARRHAPDHWCMKSARVNSGGHACRRWLIVLWLLTGLSSAFQVFATGCFSTPTGLLGWWAGDGDANDINGANNGTLQGGATAGVAGVVGSAFSLDGTSSYVQIPDSPVLRPANLTIEGWVLFTSLDSDGSGAPVGRQYIVFKQNSRSSAFEGYALFKTRVAGGDVLAFTVSSALGEIIELQSTALIATGVWYHVAGVRGSDYVQLYVNGQLANQTNLTFAQDYGTFPLYFGTSGQSYWDRKLKGLLDEVSLYNRALSLSEIAAIYAAHSDGKCKAVTITVQPQSQTVVTGTNFLFTVSATGFGTLSYQWQFDGADIGGATGASLPLANVQSTNAGSYRVVVSNTLGAVTSAVASLTVTPPPIPPAITQQPTSLTLMAGSSASFSVTALGTPPLNYQWQFNGTDVGGATNTSLLLVNVESASAGNYTVVVTNVAGSATSAVASLTVNSPPQPAAQSAGAVVLVNSQSDRYLDFQHFIQPYLDNFGFPYTVQDIATNAPGPGISNCAVIIIGHRQLDTHHVFLNPTVQANLSLAVSNGTGLVSFDNDLHSGGIPYYQFVQDIFGFSYGSDNSGSSASLPPTEPSLRMHYITARHPTNDLIAFRSGISLPAITVPAGATPLVSVGGQPLVTAVKCGQGRAVQWASYDWMVSTVLGPLDGLDDVVWRGIVWAARKPLVMRGLPNFVTMRVDDVSGPFSWVHAANAVGFKPFVALFYQLVNEESAADLQTLTTSGNATASVHSTGDEGAFLYFNHATQQPWPDDVQSNNFYLATLWHTNHGIPISKICATHYSEIGLNCFAGIKAWGMEFVPIEVVPGTIEYVTPGAPWLVGGPYRLYETPQPGQVSWPTYYADWLTVPDHPEFDGQFFNIYSEIRDVASCGEWCPNNDDVAGSISQAVRMAKRALDSMVMATIFTHEPAIAPISAASWQAILQGITNNLASYNPIYVTLDYASRYVRATRTSRVLSGAFDPVSGQVTATFSGKTDLDTQVYVFVGVGWRHH